MKCQYQAVTSTTMRRPSTGRCNIAVVTGVEQHQQSAGQVNGVGRGQQINHRAAWTGSQVESAVRKLAPGHPLSGQKCQAQHDGSAEPGKIPLFADRNSRDRLHRSQGRLPRNLPPRQFHRDAAQNQKQVFTSSNPVGKLTCSQS